MRKRDSLIISMLLAAGSVLALNAPAFANESAERCQPGQHAGDHGRGHEGFFHRRLESLGLSDEQHAQVKQIFEQQKTAREAKMKEMHESFKALREASRGDAYDAAKVREIADRQAKLRADMIVMRTDSMHQVYSLLTPEQKQKWDSGAERWQHSHHEQS